MSDSTIDITQNQLITESKINDKNPINNSENISNVPENNNIDDGEEIPKEEYEILPEDYQEHDLSFKIIIIGDSGVGKSCLLLRATKNIFTNDYSSTIGFEYCKYNIKLKDKIIKLQIWDTCGQEIYRSLISGFYRNCSTAIIVYSISE